MLITISIDFNNETLWEIWKQFVPSIQYTEVFACLNNYFPQYSIMRCLHV